MSVRLASRLPEKLRSFAARPGLRDHALIGLTCLLTAGPVVVDLLRQTPLRRVFAFVAADTFYYLTVARNAAHTGRVSFDGEHLTNGFHPLWQAMTTLLGLILRVLHVGDIWLLMAAFGLGVWLATVAVLLLGLAWRREERALTAAFVLLPFGGASVIQMPLMQHYFQGVGRPATALWGAANGMETGLVIAAYAASALAYVRAPRTRRGAVTLGLCLGTLAMARLDHGVFSVAMAASLFVFDWAHRRFALVALATFTAILGAYLVVNKLWFGMALPVSGAIKSTFPHVTPLGEALVKRLVQRPNTVSLTQGHRVLQLLVPATVAGLTLLFALLRSAWRLIRRRPRASPLDLVPGLMVATALGVLGLFAYDYLFVPPMNQGYWYFPVSNLFVSLVALEVLGAVLRVVPYASSPIATGVLTVGFTVAVIEGYGLCEVSVGDPIKAKFFFEEAPKIRAFYRARPIRMVELDDGIVTFSTGIPAMSGTGLTIDRDAIDAAGGIGEHRTNRVSLVDLGIKRGYDRFTSLLYGHGPVAPTATSRDIHRAYAYLLGAQAARCELSPEYVSQDRTFSIIRAKCPGRR